MVVTSKHLKIAVINAMLWRWHYSGATTEYLEASDVFGIRQSMYSVEVEVKVCRQDFIREINDIKAALLGKLPLPEGTKITNHNKYHKHRKYQGIYKARWDSYIPNEFYFCVPSELKDIALKEMQSIPSYGLMIYLGGTKVSTASSMIDISKRAKKLHDKKFEDISMLMHLFRKLSYEANFSREKLNAEK